MGYFPWDGRAFTKPSQQEQFVKESAMAKKKKKAGPPKSAPAGSNKQDMSVSVKVVHDGKTYHAVPHSQKRSLYKLFDLSTKKQVKTVPQAKCKPVAEASVKKKTKKTCKCGNAIVHAPQLGAKHPTKCVVCAKKEEASMTDRSEEIAKKLSPKLKLLIDKNGHNIAKKLYQEYIGDEDWGNYAHFMWRLDQLLLKMGGKPEGGDEDEKEEKGGDEPGGMEEVEPKDYVQDSGKDDATEASVADKALARLEDYHRQEESAKKKLPSRVGTHVKHKVHGKGVVTKQHPKKGYLVQWANKKTPASWHHGFHLSSTGKKKKVAKKAA
jgi:hypothetical protein